MQALGVAIWARGDAREVASQFASDHQLTYPVLVDSSDSVAKSYQVQGVPTNVVIGKDGVVRYAQGGFDPEGIRAAIEEALKE